MTKEEKEQLLEEAKRRYPVGTKYQCAAYPNREDNYIYEVKEQKFAVIDLIDSSCVHGTPGKGCLKFNGVWAKIISFPKEFSPFQLLFQPLMN